MPAAVPFDELGERLAELFRIGFQSGEEIIEVSPSRYGCGD